MQERVELKVQDLANMETKVDDLEQVRKQQANEIDMLTNTNNMLESNRKNADELSEELNRIKFTLNDVTRRQREVILLLIFLYCLFSA